MKLVLEHVLPVLRAVSKLSLPLVRHPLTHLLRTGDPPPPTSLIPLGTTLIVAIPRRRDNNAVTERFIQLALVIVTPKLPNLSTLTLSQLTTHKTSYII